MTCINLLALNNALYCSHLELKLRLLEMAVTAALSDLRDTTQSPENAAQLIRWIYDLTVLDPNSDHSKKASPKVRLLNIFNFKYFISYDGDNFFLFQLSSSRNFIPL